MDLEELKKQLTHNDPAVRISAIIELADSDIQERDNILSHIAHNDPDESIRARVRKILSRIEPIPETESSIHDVRNSLLYGTSVEKDRVMRKLLSGEITVEPAVIRQFLFSERDVINMASAVRLLGKIGDSSDLEVLVQSLSHDDPRVRANAVEALNESGWLEELEPIRALLYDPDHRVRANAILYLFEKDSDSLRPVIEDMVKSSSMAEMASIAYVLKRIDYEGSSEMLSELEKRIEDLSLSDALDEALKNLKPAR